jgi:hypothetical protein
MQVLLLIYLGLLFYVLMQFRGIYLSHQSSKEDVLKRTSANSRT